jgi:predicted thioesterase
MSITLEKGLKHTKEKTVGSDDTALKYNSGLVEVFATPAMIARMENTCLECVERFLPEGYRTVGFEVNIRHLKPTPVGEKVICNAELQSIENKKLVFNVEAFDEHGKIGEGSHIRYIIDQERFMEKLKS